MRDRFKTIEAKSEGLYKIKGSKFFAFALPVNNLEEIKTIIAAYKKEYYDARHVCYAWMLGSDKNEFRFNDDSEPSGTAGKPILGQINSRDLTNILVIVVRYFGGILLGTGGLVSAYKEAASEALNQAVMVEKPVLFNISFRFNYISLNDVMKVLKEGEAIILKQEFDNECVMSVSYPLANEKNITERLEKIDFLQII